MAKPSFIEKYQHFATGSRVICSPPVLDTDEDYVVLLEKPSGDNRRDGWQDFIADASSHGFDLSVGAMHYRGGDNAFNSWRDQNNVNLIATNDPAFFAKFEALTNAAKLINIKEKSVRVAFFQAGLYGVFPEWQEVQS